MAEPLQEAINLLRIYTAGTYNVWDVAGPQKASCRAHIMSALLGKRTPQSKSGVNAMRQAFYAAAGINESCLAKDEEAFAEFCRSGRSEKRGNWTDDPCWYVSCIDAGRTALVLGPFRTEAACREWAYYDVADGGDPAKRGMVRDRAQKRDPWSYFYAWGMVKAPNGYREGVMNSDIPEAERDMNPQSTIAELLR